MRAIPGPDAAEEKSNGSGRRSGARPAESLEDADGEEPDAVSGGADRDWEKDGCSATVETGSWCGSDDNCV